MRDFEQIDWLDAVRESDPVAELVERVAAAYTRSHEDLARRLEVAPSLLRQWRRGTSRPPPEVLDRMARELVRTSDELRMLARRLEARDPPQAESPQAGRHQTLSAGGARLRLAEETRDMFE